MTLVHNIAPFSLGASRLFTQTAQDLRVLQSTRDARLLSQLPRMADAVEAVVCICVAAFRGQEERALESTLRQLQRQAFDAERWEIIVFCNWPEGEAPDRCLAIVRGYQTEIPNLHLASMQLPTSTPIGVIRKCLHDAVGFRSEMIGRDVVQVTMDADTPWVHPGLIQGFVRHLQATGADACVGQLDWDNETIATHTVPELLVGQVMMRLLPRYGNKQIITDRRSAIGLLLEAIFSPRSFGRGVQSNFAFRTSAYQRAGGYLPQPHDEFDSLLRRIWLSRFLIEGDTQALTFGWEADGVAVKSDSRRALWALAEADLPPMRQWDKIPFLSHDRVRSSLPDVTTRLQPDLLALEHQINLTLEAFNLPPAQLNLTVSQALADVGLSPLDYKLVMASYEPDPILGLAQIRMTNPEGLWCWIRQQQAIT